jgi:hypothetical protein
MRKFEAQGLAVHLVIAERTPIEDRGVVPWLGESAGSLLVWPGSSLVQ